MFEFEQLGLEEVTPAQVKSVFAYLLNLKISELEEITKDKEQPAINRIVAKNMLGGKGFEIIEKMLDRAHGKALQTNETKITSNIDPFAQIRKNCGLDEIDK